MRARRSHVLAAIGILALVVGVGAAVAATSSSGSDLKREAARLTQRATSEASIAKALGTTTAKLNAAIQAAAVDRIDAAEKAGDITADEASTLKQALADNELPAMHLATAAAVAKELGTTEDKLNAAYADAQKARAIARVDAALTAGQITQSYADQLKANIDKATFPGFGADGPGGPHGFGGHRGGPGFGFGGPGFDLGPGGTDA